MFYQICTWELVQNTKPKKMPNLFLIYLYYITLNVTTCFDRQWTVIREAIKPK